MPVSTNWLLGGHFLLPQDISLKSLTTRTKSLYTTKPGTASFLFHNQLRASNFSRLEGSIWYYCCGNQLHKGTELAGVQWRNSLECQVYQVQMLPENLCLVPGRKTVLANQLQTHPPHMSFLPRDSKKLLTSYEQEKKKERASNEQIKRN